MKVTTAFGERKKYPIVLSYCLKISKCLCAVFLFLASCREVCEIMQNYEDISLYSYQLLARMKKNKIFVEEYSRTTLL